MCDIISLKVKNHFGVQIRGMILPFAEDPQNSWCWEQYSLRDNHHLLEVIIAFSLLTLQPAGKYCIYFELLPTSCCLVCSLHSAAACQ